MNEETRKLRDLVERATAASDELPHDRDAEAADAETASLRGGWLQLGELIEQDLQSGAGKIGAGHIGKRRSARALHAPSASRHRSPAWPFWIATIAASLMVATGVVFAVRFLGATHEPPNENAPQQIAGTSDPTAKQAVNPVDAPKSAIAQAKQPAAQIAATDNLMQWGDSVDDEITAVGQATIDAQQDAYAQSSGTSGIQTDLDELKREIDQGNL